MGVAAIVASAGVIGSGCAQGDPPIDAPLDPVTGVPQLPLPRDLDDPALPPLGSTSTSTAAVTAALDPTAGCEDIFSVLRAQAVAEITQQVQASFASAWHQSGHCDDYWGGGYNDGGAMPMADAGAAAPPPTGEGDPEHSETNNQVAGVDEADVVKTDGKHIYTISGGTLRIIQSWPAAQTKQIAKVALEGEPKKLFVLGDRLLVYAALGSDSGYGNGGECTYGYGCVPTGDGRPTMISLLDISDRAAPRLLREVKVSSSLLAARRIGPAVHTVVTATASQYGHYLPSWPQGLDACEASHYQIYVAFKKLLADNIKEILGRQMSDVVPTVVDTVHRADGTKTVQDSPLVGCKAFFKDSLADGQQFTSVLSLAMDDQQPTQAVTIFSAPGVVYASQDSLYLAVPRQRSEQYGWYEDCESDEATTVHKFKLSSETPSSRYVASGLVKGRLLNQFALDEHQGFLRVASTTGYVGYNSNAHNTLTVLEQQQAKLVQVGLLDHLAPSEDIRSVRFDGERGYVVTFKKTDPLFVLDLADPQQPKVLGELKIPGFSTYMQKMDGNHLLTIGYDAEDMGDFAWFSGVMLQIFDVTDPTNPKLEHKHVIGTRGSSSEALTNHLAFTYYAPKNMLALPMTICEGGEGGSYGAQLTFSGLMVFNATAQAGFSLRGKVAHPLGDAATCGNWWTNASSQVKRSLVIDNYVYSFSDELLKVNDLDALQTDLASVSLK